MKKAVLNEVFIQNAALVQSLQTMLCCPQERLPG